MKTTQVMEKTDSSAAVRMLCLLAAYCALSASAATTITVDPDAEETSTTVNTLEAAFRKLSSSGDTILVRPGTYTITETLTNKVSNFVLRSADASTGEIDAENTIIDGSSCPDRALYNYSQSAPTINGFTFRNCTSSGNGGAMYMYGSGAYKVLNCVFTNNTSSSSGGAIYSLLNAGGVISNCYFSGNHTSSTGNSFGGAVYAQQNSENSHSDKTTLYGCVFTNNWIECQGTAQGGAVCASRTMHLVDCRFCNNYVHAGSGKEVDGGTAYFGGVSRLTNCVFTAQNTADREQGSFYGRLVAFGQEYAKEIEGCTFGPVSFAGGSYGVVTIFDSATGYLFSNTKFLSGVTFRRHNAATTGTLRNCLCLPFGTASNWAYENCTFVMETDGTAVSSEACAFTNCLSNGSAPTADGATATSCLFAGTTAGCGFIKPGTDYRLRSTSAAVDAGTTLSGQDEDVDLAGRSRVVGERVDIGAYERQDGDVDVYYVRAVPTEEEKTGDWADAYVGVQDAVDAAEPYDVVLVKGGTYALKSPVTISGKHLEVKSAETGAAVLDGQGSCQVLNVQNASAYDISVEGFVIKNGAAASGGGIYAEGYGGTGVSPILFKDCIVTNCTSTGDGGGIYAKGGVVFTNCTVVGNTSAASGGGVCASATSAGSYRSSPTTGRNAFPTFECCAFVTNNATNGNGGGLYNARSALVDGCRFEGNTQSGSDQYGGAVYAGMNLWIKDSIIVGNGKSSYAGGVFVGQTGFYAERTTFTGGNGGFGCVFSTHSSVFVGCVFTNNTVSPIYITPCQLRNCLFDSKPFNFNGRWQVENCTFMDGVNFRTDGSGSLAATNCIFMGSSPFSPAPGERVKVEAANCCFQSLPSESDYCSLTSCFSADPKFVDTSVGNYRLQDSSKCRDRGVILDWMTEDAVDADGNQRRIDTSKGVYLATALPDLGCYENQTKWTPPGLMLIFR